MARPYRIRGYWGWDMGVGGRADGSPLQDSKLLRLGYGRGRASRWLAPTGFEVIRAGIWAWAGEPRARPYRIRGYWGWDMGVGGQAEGSPPTRFEVIGVGIWAWAGEPMARPYRIRGYWGWDMGVGGRADGTPLRVSRLLGLGYGRGRASRWLAPTRFEVIRAGIWAWAGEPRLAPTGFEVIGVGIWAWAGEPMARPYRIRGY